MSLQINTNQFFTPTTGITLTPLYSNWQWRSSSNANLPNVVFRKNSPQSTVMTYQIKPRQGYEMWINEGYTGLKIKHEVIYGPNVAVSFFLDSPLIPQMNYTSNVGNTWYNLNIGISPNVSTPLGLNKITVRFFIEGIKNGQTVVLSTYDFPINLHVIDEGSFFSPLNFTFLKSNNIAPSQLLVVGGENWTLIIPNGLKITSTTATIVQLPNGGYSSVGTGETNFNLSFDDNISSVLGSNSTLTIPILVNYPNQNYTIPVQIIQTGDVYPSSLDFYISSGLINYSYQEIIINKLGDVTFSAPSYLEVTFQEVENKRFLRVYVLDPENLGSGVFQDNIILHVGSSIFTIPVRISVSDAFDIGIENEVVNFTKSMNDLVFHSNNQNTFIELFLIQSNINREFTYRIPFSSGNCSKNIGLVLDRMINYNNPDLEFLSTLPSFSLIVKEKKSELTILEFSKNNIPYIKGYKPFFANGRAILQHNKQSRFTAKSFALISLMSISGTYNYSVRKNSNVVFESPMLSGNLVTMKLEFSDYNSQPGDLIEFVLHSGGQEIVKSFVIFPETDSSFEIVYEDSFGLKSVLNFTGNSIKVLRELNNVFETFQYKTAFHQRKLKISDEKTLTLNTGFILKSQILEVDELLDSKNAWLYIDGEKRLSLVPKLEKITTLDSDDFTVSYTIEFIINTDTYAQDYSF